MATNGRSRYFRIDENASSEQIYAFLGDVESANEDDIGNLTNDSDTKFIAEEEITEAASTQNVSLTTPEANLHVVTISHRREKRTRKKDYGSGLKKQKLPSKKSVTMCQKYNSI